MSKLVTLAAAATGYVLGARAGRERYEQIVAGAGRVWRDPRTRSARSNVGSAVKESAPKIKDRVVDAVTSDDKDESKPAVSIPETYPSASPGTAAAFDDGTDSTAAGGRS